ncbi:MAG: alpha/beta hydrolase [Actinomycetota bacterium]|nr:alpha/beta hydrolase [Actinomycetota bacterium]
MSRGARQWTRTAIYTVLGVAVLAGPAPASAQVELKRCPKVHPEARCGKVPAPLERGNPASRQIGIHVTVLRHTNRKRPPLTPVYVIYGGPGFAPSFSVEGGLFLLEEVRGRHDLVMVDYRGEGRSDAVNCRPLQRLETSNAAAIQSAVGACGAQLGSTADDYGAADVADDVEAVRAAFGHPLINVYGQSYGTVHAQAYALRHGSHLRSLILDGAFSPLAYDTDTQAGVDIAAASARSVALICRRSPSCARDNPRPARALARLAARLRARPFRGVGRDALGDRKRVRMNEAGLARIVGGDDFAYIGQSEVPAAAVALRNGDRRPLLRLAALTGPDFANDAGYRRDSAGMAIAAGCADFPAPWDVNASIEQRRAQAAAAWAALPHSTFSPFSPQGWLDYWAPEVCVEWPAPLDPEPVFIPGVSFPDVPAFVISAELDLVTSEAEGRFTAGLFPNSRFVVLRNGGHTPGYYSLCTAPLYARFFRTLETGSTRCMERGDVNRPAIGRFPLRARGARPARARRADRSRTIDRRVVTVAWLTLQDALRLNGFVPTQTVKGVGLRGGRFVGAFSEEQSAVVFRLRRLRFSRDVRISGRAKLAFGETSVATARVRVNGPRGADGRLTLRGRWFGPGARTIRITGQLGGRRVAAVVPAG